MLYIHVGMRSKHKISVKTRYSMNNYLGMVILGSIAIAIFIINPNVGSWNDASRMATVESLVERHTFIIDHSTFWDTGDKVYINGHFYSDKPVMPSLLGAVVYFPLYYLGLNLDYGINLAYYIITLLTIKIFWLFGLLAFYSVLAFCKIEAADRLLLTFSLGLASLHFTWSSTFNNHSLAASLLMIGFYYLVKSKFSEIIKKKYLIYSGFFISLAGTADMPTAAFYVGFLLYILAHPKLRGLVTYYLLPTLLTVLPVLFINFSIHGSILPFQINASYFEYPGSHWSDPNSLSGVKVNSILSTIYYCFTYLIGPKGFLIYNPLLLVALPYLFRETTIGKSFRAEALVIGIVCTVILLYYSAYTSNYSGWSYSIRWFVPVLPLLFFFIHPFFHRAAVKGRRLFVALIVISMIISSVGVINPWTNEQNGINSFYNNFQQIRQYTL